MPHLMYSTFGVAFAVATAVAATATSPLAAQRQPAVDIWFDGGNSFDRGAAVPLRYSADRGSYVAVVRVDGDGQFTILAPFSPNARSNTSGTTAMSVPFRADAQDGVGYVFAIASRSPFDFRQYRSRSGGWIAGALASRAGVDPFELVDQFARNIAGRTTDYTIAYAPYEVGSGSYHVRSAYNDRGAVYMDDGYYDAYNDGYGYGYYDPWISSPYRRRYSNYRYPVYNPDPRSQYLRHCPDGTLAPYTVLCGPTFRGYDSGRFDRGGRDMRYDGVIRGMAGGTPEGLQLYQRRMRGDTRFNGRYDGRYGGRTDGTTRRDVRRTAPTPHPMPTPAPAPRIP